MGYYSQHVCTKRWVRTTLQEHSGNVKFSVTRNDSKRASYLMLLRVKNILEKQLPNMPRLYASRLMLDQKHESYALSKQMRRLIMWSWVDVVIVQLKST